MKRIFSFLASAFIAMLLLLPTAVRAESDEYISDTYGVLNEAELEALNDKARALSDKYEFGVYAHILFDNESYDDIWGFAEKYWDEMNLGYENTGDGILFIITQSDRGGSYNIYVPSTSNQDYFTISALDDIESYAEQGLFDHNYFDAINTFLDQTEQKLDFYAEYGYAWPGNASMNSSVIDSESLSRGKTLATFCIPPIIALIVVIIRASKHKTRRLATTAGAYIAPYGQLQLTSRTDMFLHRTRSRVRVRSDNSGSSGGSSGSGGGGHSSSGGMHSGGGHF